MLDRITLTRFRNHPETRLDGACRFNLLIGENGAGKTNVLEAISLLAPGRGLRRAALAAMLQEGRGPERSEQGFAVSALLQCGDDAEPVTLATGTLPDRPNRRVVHVNGAQASALALGEWLGIGWLTPAMDRLFAESAGGRRRFMDRMALAHDPAQARHAAAFDKALAERNRLISAETEPDPAWLDAIEAQMATAGAALTAGRTRWIAALNAELAHLPDQPFARPLLAYAPGGPVEAEALAQDLHAHRARDRAAGRTLAGPHRDDLVVVMAGKNMPAAACSTGEQKAMLIALVLAQAAPLAHPAAPPQRPGVLLLDEVAAHLDPLRRAALFDRLRSGAAQVWMTGTETAPFAAIHEEAAVWQVADGHVQRVS